MAIPVQDPIYRTEVVQVSELSQARGMTPDSLFLIAQNNRSKKLTYELLEKTISAAVFDGIDEKIKQPAKDIKKLSGDITDYYADLSEQIFDLSAAAFDEISRKTVRVSADIIAKEDKKISNVSTKLDSLKQFVEDQGIDKLSKKQIVLQTLVDQLSATDAKIIADFQKTDAELSAQILHALPQQIQESAERVAKIAANGDKEVKASLQKQIESTARRTSIEVSQLSGNVDKKIVALSTELSSETATFNDEISTLFALNDDSVSAQAELSSSISALSAQLYDDGDIFHLSSDLSTLDIKLYGLRFIEEDDEGITKENIIKVGDIDCLSSSIAVEQSKVISLSSTVLTIASNVSSFIAEAYVIDTVNGGPYTIDPDTTTVCNLNITRVGYHPISISEVIVKDDQGLDPEDIIPMNRYVCSSEKAHIELKSLSKALKTCTVAAIITYLKKQS